MIKRFSILLAACAMLAGCGVQLDKEYSAGKAVVVFPDNGGTTLWELAGDGQPAFAGAGDIGGGYRAVALQPGVYRLYGVYNVAKIGTLGGGSKDLDYAERLKRKQGGAEKTLSGNAPGGLGVAAVTRAPVREERDIMRGEKIVGTRRIDVSSQYRMLLGLPASADVCGGFACFEIKAGDVLLVPALHGAITMNEKACARSGSAVTVYDMPSQNFVLSENPEDFETLKWACPVERLVFTKITGSVEDVRARANSGKFSLELMNSLKEGEMRMGRRLLNAYEIKDEASGRASYLLLDNN